MHATEKYLALCRGEVMVAIAGVHAYSANHRVAALSDIATLPLFRGQGLAQKITAILCADLFASDDAITLNVHSEHAAAIAAYKNIGFQMHNDAYKVSYSSLRKIDGAKVAEQQYTTCFLHCAWKFSWHLGAFPLLWTYFKGRHLQ